MEVSQDSCFRRLTHCWVILFVFRLTLRRVGLGLTAGVNWTHTAKCFKLRRSSSLATAGVSQCRLSDFEVKGVGVTFVKAPPRYHVTSFTPK